MTFRYLNIFLFLFLIILICLYDWSVLESYERDEYYENIESKIDNNLPDVNKTNISSTEQTTNRTRRVLVKHCNIIGSKTGEDGRIIVQIYKPFDYNRDTCYVTEDGKNIGILKMSVSADDTLINIEKYRENLDIQTKLYAFEYKNVIKKVVPESRAEFIEKSLLAKNEAENEYKFYLYKNIIFSIVSFLSFFYFVRYYRISFKLVGKFLYYEKKMRKIAFLTNAESIVSYREFDTFSAYIEQSLLMQNMSYNILIEKDAFKPLLTAIENYRDCLLAINNYAIADLLTDHLAYVIKFKKRFDKKIAKLRIIKKNEPHKFINKNAEIITHEDIMDYYG